MERINISFDGTIKIDFQGYSSVIIPSINNKLCVCLSCQIGCPVKCSICLSGKMKFKRNLTRDEIVHQFTKSQEVLGEKITSVVFMGSGEPSLNLENVLVAAEEIHKISNIPYRRITISSAGLKNLDSLANIKFNLAISLHSPFDSKRKKISPLLCSTKKILNVSKKYVSQHKKNYIMIEYPMIDGFNDSEKDLAKLVSLPWPGRTIFNLIELNESGNLSKASMEKIQFFKKELIDRGYKCFIRNSRGKDIEASCGMIHF